ncbi:glycosyltransferase [Halomonas sp. CKK8]|uniref:glycosyltransferase n=1 Tax=Halomonas sp. CKK8 TaxID=3036127 RepID=UPI002414E715|nr:glycosyltransferase [Halomonas sp. CKK8]WFM69795.1 glycosyltransferase [Halomonas sp. CKK8]
MRRILFVTDHLGGGGAPLSILALAGALAARGCAVTIVSLQDKVWHSPPAGVDIQVVSFTYRGPWQKLRRYHLHARRLDAWVGGQPGSFELVVANLHYSHQVVNRSSLADQAWLCIRTDPGAALLKPSRYRHRLSRFRRLYHGRKVLAISRGILDSLAHHDVVPAESRLIYNIIDAKAIRAAMTETVPFEDFIVYVGRLDRRQKRYDRLLKAYEASGVTQPLVVVGDGEVTAAKALAESMGIADRVSFVGKKANPYPYMYHARLLVLASDYEGFGRVIAESLVCGTPVVSTDCPSGPREILRDELADCLAPLDDGEALGRRIAELMAHPPAIMPSHYAAFSPERVSDQYLQLLPFRGELPPSEE